MLHNGNSYCTAKGKATISAVGMGMRYSNSTVQRPYSIVIGMQQSCA